MTANVYGGSDETVRGTWCTPKDWAEAVGPWDLDPFSNPRSHILSEQRCMLEDGGDGLLSLGVRPGAWRNGATRVIGCAAENTRVWIQPPYSLVHEALDHYGHTRWCALLRFDPRTEWFKRITAMCSLIAVPRKCEFEPPPELAKKTKKGTPKKGANPVPHALYFANAADVTPAVLSKSALAWRTR